MLPTFTWPFAFTRLEKSLTTFGPIRQDFKSIAWFNERDMRGGMHRSLGLTA